jgi:hypothetical protein
MVLSKFFGALGRPAEWFWDKNTGIVQKKTFEQVVCRLSQTNKTISLYKGEE